MMDIQGPPVYRGVDGPAAGGLCLRLSMVRLVLSLSKGLPELVEGLSGVDEIG